MELLAVGIDKANLRSARLRLQAGRCDRRTKQSSLFMSIEAHTELQAVRGEIRVPGHRPAEGGRIEVHVCNACFMRVMSGAKCTTSLGLQKQRVAKGIEKDSVK